VIGTGQGETTMRKGLWLAAASVLVLAGCEQAAEEPASEAEIASAPAEAGVGSDMAAPTSPTAALPAPVARIAYGFAYALSVPRDRGAELMSRHELTCAAAGPGFCQVVSAQADWSSRRPGGRLELRGQPDWINRFRAGLAADARDAGGRLETAVTEGEDLTTRIEEADQGVRTEADLAARIRDLQTRRGGTLEQRLAIERELADLRRRQDALARGPPARRKGSDRDPGHRLSPGRRACRRQPDAASGSGPSGRLRTVHGHAGRPDHRRIDPAAGRRHRRGDLVGDPPPQASGGRLRSRGWGPGPGPQP
jgi:hypothetical protein